MNHEELFIDGEEILIVRKELAKLIGLNEAIVLNQIHYWLKRNKEREVNFIDGRYWTFNTYDEWKEKNFPFWSMPTIKRTFLSLEKIGVVISANYNKMSFDKTKWYSIDYEKLEEIKENQRLYQNDTTSVSDCANRENQNEPNNTRDLKENNKKTKVNTSSLKEHDEGQRKIISSAKDVKQEMLRRVEIICKDCLGYEDDISHSVLGVIDYYFDMYFSKVGRFHPKMSDDTLINVIEKLVYGTDMFGDLIYSLDDYKSLIDRHFSKDYGISIDWHLPHFATDGILEKLAYQTVC